ncbi:MAG: hypothetical protein Q8Q26_18420, partial [Pseudorhodobacter sp.]|nr:hypothetical protein [Pseudorhodobacter sp.]
MKAEQIKTPENLREWLQSFPQEGEAERNELHRLLLGLAQRASMRVLPHFWSWGWTDAGRELSDSALVGLRCTLISQIALHDPDSKIDQFARPAFKTAQEIYNLMGTNGQAPLQSVIAGLASADKSSMTAAIQSAGTAAYMTFALGRDVEIQNDAAKLTDGHDALSLPLWQEQIPNQVLTGERWKEIRDKQAELGPDWKFWIEWYENSLHGHSQGTSDQRVRLRRSVSLIASVAAKRAFGARFCSFRAAISAVLSISGRL